MLGFPIPELEFKSTFPHPQTSPVIPRQVLPMAFWEPLLQQDSWPGFQAEDQGQGQRMPLQSQPFVSPASRCSRCLPRALEMEEGRAGPG